jgi:hypothetical protein
LLVVGGALAGYELAGRAKLATFAVAAREARRPQRTKTVFDAPPIFKFIVALPSQLAFKCKALPLEQLRKAYFALDFVPGQLMPPMVAHLLLRAMLDRDFIENAIGQRP